jgi:hypothetical protein
MTKRIYQGIGVKNTKITDTTYVLRSSESYSGDAIDLLETKTQQGFSRLTLSARLDFVEGSRRRRVLLVVVVVIVIVVMLMIMLMLVLGVIRDDFFDSCGHGLTARNPKPQSAIHRKRSTFSTSNSSSRIHTWSVFWLDSSGE